MLELNNLVITYPGPPRYTAVDGINLVVERGSTVGLVGESGSGKSTIARAVVGLVRVSDGSIILDSTDVTNARGRVLRDLRHRVQLVFQDPTASLNPRLSIGQSIREAVAVSNSMGIRSPATRQGADELMEMVELPIDVIDRFPSQLSGGQLQRVAIARALATRPPILLLDEVTASLDVSVQAVILNLLTRLQRELSLTLLYISHDLSVIRYVSDQVVVMQHGKLIEEGDADELFANPTDPYTRSLLAAVPTLGGGRWRSRSPGIGAPKFIGHK